MEFVAAAGVSVAFVVVFGIFAVAFVALLIYIAVWAIRRDQGGRREWQENRDSSPGSPSER